MHQQRLQNLLTTPQSSVPLLGLAAGLDAVVWPDVTDKGAQGYSRDMCWLTTSSRSAG